MCLAKCKNMVPDLSKCTNYLRRYCNLKKSLKLEFVGELVSAVCNKPGTGKLVNFQKCEIPLPHNIDTQKYSEPHRRFTFAAGHSTLEFGGNIMSVFHNERLNSWLSDQLSVWVQLQYGLSIAQELKTCPTLKEISVS